MLALGLSTVAAYQLRGRNFSDVGVPMYPYTGFAMVAGIAIYGICTAAGFYGLRKMQALKNSLTFIVIHAALLPLDLLAVRLAVIF